MKNVIGLPSLLVLGFVLLVGLHCARWGAPAAGAIYRWDNGELITEKDAEPRAQLSAMGLQYADLAGAQLFSASFASTDLTFAHLMGADLTYADFSDAHLTGADFSGALVGRAWLSRTTSRGFTAEQLYSTASYQQGDLRHIHLNSNDLSGWDFAAKNLTYARFQDANLTNASFSAANLTYAYLYQANLTGASLRGANLTRADFSRATLTEADFSGGIVAYAGLGEATSRGLAAGQFYSTASYQSGDLRGVSLMKDDLSGWDFAGKNLEGASLHEAHLTDTVFSGAIVRGASFAGTTSRGFVADQLYSTASYQSGDLSGINWQSNDLRGWDLAGKNLVDASFWGADLAGTSFAGAVIRGAKLPEATTRGFTADQFYSTASYQSGDLSRIALSNNDLTGWDFSGKNLSGVGFSDANVTGANFSGANLTGAWYTYATLVGANFTGADISRAGFDDTTKRGFTAQQFYSTATYQGGDLTEIGLSGNDLSGWSFRGKNLTNAGFSSSKLIDADFGEAIIQAADLWYATNGGFTAEQLYSTASYQSGDLTQIELFSNDLSGWKFAGKNLTGASFSSTNLSDTDFTEAVVDRADFSGTTRHGFTAEQFYATATYKRGDLTDMRLGYNDLTGWSFAGKDLAGANLDWANLTAADFSGASLMRVSFRVWVPSIQHPPGGYLLTILTNANLSFSDLRGANVEESQLVSAASTEGAILPDGRIEGLVLDAGERLVVRDFNGDSVIPVTVQSVMILDREAALRMVFEDDLWGSTISFEPGVAVSLGGSLELLFADDISPTALIGKTFDLFDWHGAVVSGRFDRVVTEADATWDLSNLYSTGEVRLVSVVPEPSALVLLGIGICVALAGARQLKRRSARAP